MSNYTEEQLKEIQATIDAAVAPLKAQLEEERQKKGDAHRDLNRALKRIEQHIGKGIKADMKIAVLRGHHDEFRNWIHKVLGEMDKILPCAYTEPWMCSPLRQQGVELVRPKVKIMNNERGLVKKALESAGVTFTKCKETDVWTAYLDGKEIADSQSKTLGYCVLKAAEAVGEK